MAKRCVVKHTWNEMNHLETAGLAQKVGAATDSNVTFKDSKVPKGALSAVATRVIDAWAKKDNGQVAADEMTNSLVAARAMLLEEAYFVDGIADGDSDIIHWAGYESILDTHTKHNAPETPRASRLESKSGGVVKSTVTTVPDTNKYTHIAVIDGPFNVTILHGEIIVPNGTNAIILPYSNISATFTGLPAHKSIAVGVIAHNNGGASGISTISTTSALP